MNFLFVEYTTLPRRNAVGILYSGDQRWENPAVKCFQSQSPCSDSRMKDFSECLEIMNHYRISKGASAKAERLRFADLKDCTDFPVVKANSLTFSIAEWQPSLL